VARSLAAYQWILNEGRKDLRGVISADLFRRLCDTYLGEKLDPSELDNLAGRVLDHAGWDDDETRPLPAFAQQLMSLSSVQSLALREMVERFWYQKKSDLLGIEDFLIANGVIERSD
jgi:hypothetical protein